MLTRALRIILLIAVFMAAAGIGTYMTIHLLIGGKNNVVVPDLEGKDIVYALEMLTDLDLDIKVPGSAFSATVPKNHVISQEPAPGSEIKPGRDVRLVISKGARAVIVPNLTGISVPQARILLDENGLAQQSLSYIHDSGFAQNDIISQYPLPGHQSFRGSPVELLVSAGPALKLAPMADLIGVELDQAMLALEQYHLTVAAIHYIDDEQLPDDTISDHKPQAGYPVNPIDGVELIVNRKHRSPRLARKGGVDLFRYRVQPGFLRRSVKVLISHPASKVELFNAYVRPGEEIWLLIPFTSSSTLMLYTDDVLVETKHYDNSE